MARTGVPTVDLDRGAGLADVIEARTASRPDAVALVAPSRVPLTYGQLARQLQESRHTLRTLGVGRHDRIALVLPNGPEMAAAALAVAASAACAPLDPALRADEYGRYLARLRPAAAVLQAGVESPARAMARQLAIPIIELHPRSAGAAGLFTLVGAGRAAAGTAPAGAGDIALILPTSGTTAQPKLVALTHANLLASAQAVARSLALGPGDRCLNVMPLFHIHGLVGALLSSLVAGASAVCTSGLHAPGFSAWLQTHRPTWYTAVPAMHEAILAHVRSDRLAGHGLRFIRSCSAALPLRVLAALEATFGVPVIEAYGMTEAAHQIASNPLPPRPRKTGSVGVATGVDVAILDAAGASVAPGQPGELAVRGASVTAGYLDDPQANATAFAGAWLRTGDLGRIDADGYLFLTGRLKELINRGGEKIAPAEVEDTLLAHPAVAEAVVFPAPHAQLGEEVAAAVVLRDGAALTTGALRAFVAARLAEFKVPGRIVFVSELARGRTGKPRRVGLAESLGLTETRAGEHAVPVPPRTPDEQQLARLWREVLELDVVGVHDDFLELGGDSLLAARLLARVRQAMAVEVPIHLFFETPTIAALAQHAAAGAATAATIPRLDAAARGGDLPLSFAQEWPWFFDQIAPGNPAYNRPVALRLAGPLDRPALDRSLAEIVRRHAVLQAIFPAIDGQPVQRPGSSGTLTLVEMDLRLVPAAEREAAARREAAAATRRSFDLARHPPVRSVLLRLDDREHVLLLVLHHIVVDGWSATVLVRELAALYEAFAAGLGSPLPELPLQYADVTVRQRQCVQGEVLERGLAYWTARLAGAPSVLPLPTDFPRPARPTFLGARETMAIPEALVPALRALGRRDGATLFMTLLAAFEVLLYRYTGQDDLVIGVPVAGRTHVETEGLIGCFVNTIALRADLSGSPTFHTLLARVRDGARQGYAHQDVPFAKLVQALRPGRDSSYMPLVQVVFNLERFPDPPARAGGVTIEEFAFDPGEAPMELLVEVIESGARLTCVATYTTDLFSSGSIRRLLRHYLAVLEAVAADPEQAIDAVPLLADSERRELLLTRSRAAEVPAEDRTLHELFRAQAARTPDAVAAICGAEQLTFGELNRRANGLAHHLRGLGVVPEARVGICLERSLDTIVAVLAALKAGGAYVPLDPALPPQRLALMLEEAGCAVVLTRRALTGALPAIAVPVICIEALPEILEREPDSDPVVGVTGDGLAYVVYTSGSTGRPNGILGLHRGMANLVACWRQAYPMTAGDVWGQRSGFGLVDFLQEIMTPLLQGFPVAVIPDDEARDPGRLLESLAAHRVTRLMVVPSILRACLDLAPDLGRRLPTLRLCSVGGESLPRELYQRICAALPGVRLLQGYGMTEASTKAVWCEADGMDPRPATVPIGRPVGNVEVYALDRRLEPVPVGVPGELYIGGVGVNRGYVGRPDLTAERFVPHPFGDPGARLYRTGDLARHLPDGTIECLGRTDGQVKVRGLRVEVSEIEATLERHPAIRQAVVLARTDGSREMALVAYISRGSRAMPGADTLRRFARTLLPEYMVPGIFVVLDALPLLPGGKVNRAALPAPDTLGPEPEHPFIAPGTPVERGLAEIWADVLGLDRAGVADNFFELGGHSLLAIRIINGVTRRYEVTLSLRTLLDNPTIAELAAVVARQLAERAPAAEAR